DHYTEALSDLDWESHRFQSADQHDLYRHHYLVAEAQVGLGDVEWSLGRPTAAIDRYHRAQEITQPITPGASDRPSFDLLVQKIDKRLTRTVPEAATAAGEVD